MVQRYHEHSTLKPSTGASNAKELNFDLIDSGYKVGTAGSRAVGRSGTLQYFHGCLDENTLVIDANSNSLKPIKYFKIGDIVRTHLNNNAPISFISNQEKECLSLTLRTLSKFPIVASKEHKFYTKQGWKEINEISIGDAIGYPIVSIKESIADLPLPDSPTRSHGGGRQGIYPDSISANYELGRALGLYVAEGSIKLNSNKFPCAVIFSIHRKETDRTVNWLNYFNNCFSSVSIRHRKNSLTTVVECYGNRFALLVDSLCGRKENKHIPVNWSEYGVEFVRGLLHGYISGDGHSSSKERRIRATSILSNITLTIRDIAASLGYGWGCIEYKKAAIRSGRNEKEAFTFSLCGDGVNKLASEIGKESVERTKKHVASIKRNSANGIEISEGYAWLRVNEVKNAGLRTVYDFEVNHADHSYCTIHGASHNSEVSFWPNAQSHLAGVMQSIADADDTEIILESTANGIGGVFYEMWKSAERGEGDYIPIFIPWFWQSEYRKNDPSFNPNAKEKKLIEQYGLDHEQLAWRRSKIAELRSEQLFNQEYPNTAEEAFITSGRTVFDMELLKDALANCFAPVKRMAYVGKKWEDRKDGELRVWFDPKPGAHYVIGGDVAEGLIHGDYSCLDVLELPEGTQVAQWHGHIAPDKLAYIAKALGERYNKAFIGIESNNHGLTTLVSLRDSGYANIYARRDVEDRGSGDKETKKIGWLTTSKTKPLIIDNLNAELREKTHGLSCKDTVAEMMTYIVEDNGSYNAQDGCYDDRVMARAIAGEMLKAHYSYKNNA